MPNAEKVLRGAQVAPLASVEPTTQAVIPTQWKRLSRYNIPAYLSSTPDLYAITIYGAAFNHTTSQMIEVERQRIYRANHPTLAVGKAVLDFLNDNCRGSISRIEILKGIN